MKSLIKVPKKPDETACCPSSPTSEPQVAQCCAKVSKTVAGCHD